MSNRKYKVVFLAGLAIIILLFLLFIVIFIAATQALVHDVAWPALEGSVTSETSIPGNAKQGAHVQLLVNIQNCKLKTFPNIKIFSASNVNQPYLAGIKQHYNGSFVFNHAHPQHTHFDAPFMDSPFMIIYQAKNYYPWRWPKSTYMTATFNLNNTDSFDQLFTKVVFSNYDDFLSYVNVSCFKSTCF